MIYDLNYHRYGPPLHFTRQLHKGFIGYYPVYTFPNIENQREEKCSMEDSQRPIRKRPIEDTPGMLGAGIGTTPSESVQEKQRKLLKSLPTVLKSKRMDIDIAPISNASQSSNIHRLE